MSQGPVLRPEEVAGILGGAEATPAPAAGPVRYSLRDPVAIPPQAEAEGRKRLDGWAGAFHTALLHELGDEVAIGVDGLLQQRASAALTSLPPPAWLLAMAAPRGGGLALALPAALGLALVERALGGSAGKADEARNPTSLELRVMSRLTGALAAALTEATGETWSPLPPSVGSVPTAVAAPAETVAVGLLRVKVEASERAALLLVSTAILVSRERVEAPRASERVGPLTPALGRVRLAVRPVLRAGGIRLHELIDLRAGAVFVLDAAEDAPFDLRVEGQTVFTGRIARRDGAAAFNVLTRRGRLAVSRKEVR